MMPLVELRRKKLRVVGDVHGDARGFAHAVATDRFVIQLGDLTDHGPDSAGALDIALDLLASGRGLFLLGNHDLKLARALRGEAVRRDAALEATLAAIGPALAAAALPALFAAPAWLRVGPRVFVHAGFHSAMLDSPAPPPPEGRVRGPLSRALYGQPTGAVQADGYPERSIAWIGWIPAGFTVYCGHDRRSTDGRPWVRRNDAGGTAVFLDTGAGKGGHLSWIDLPPVE
jgi:protein phosphatase